ncbi:hypothetical protein C7M84_021065 [Penaeus vannamei]|uniref:Uncharacterized protein n=1 Tax=Penaeus vannamei TaxID=6689 RepID=A0A3R7SH84_PENVA|nr:hypothetical protein C7M84_021065 [Penaeus vannamei]
MLVRRSPPALRGVPVPRLRKRVCDTLTRNPLFRPSGKEFNHGIRRRYALAPTQEESLAKNRQTTDISISSISRMTERILAEVFISPPSSPDSSDSLQSAPFCRSRRLLLLRRLSCFLASPRRIFSFRLAKFETYSRSEVTVDNASARNHSGFCFRLCVDLRGRKDVGPSVASRLRGVQSLAFGARVRHPRNPLFRPAGKEFNHGIRRRYGLAPTQEEGLAKNRQTTDISISSISRMTECILAEVFVSPPSSPDSSDSLQSAPLLATPAASSSSFLPFQTLAPQLPFRRLLLLRRLFSFRLAKFETYSRSEVAVDNASARNHSGFCFRCVSTCEAVRMLVRRSPPALRGVPVPRLRKRVCDTLTRNPLFRPAGKEFNHGIRRRYGLAPTQGRLGKESPDD